MSPAIVNSVKIEKSTNFQEKSKAIITINSDQKGKAIGRDGLNIRLASMLTNFEIVVNEVNVDTPVSNDEAAKISEEKAKDVSSLEALFK